MKKAFTMVELIFVIVIIGILAAVAIPKLAATRDDANAAKAAKNLAICITDIGASYTSKGQESTDTTGAAFASCKAVINESCFKLGGIESSRTSDGNITVVNISNTKARCIEAHAIVATQGLSGSSAVTHSFGGSKISF